MNEESNGMIHFGLPDSQTIFHFSKWSPTMGSEKPIYTGKTLPCFDDLINIVTSAGMVPENAYPRLYASVYGNGYSVYLIGYWV